MRYIQTAGAMLRDVHCRERKWKSPRGYEGGGYTFHVCYFIFVQFAYDIEDADTDYA